MRRIGGSRSPNGVEPSGVMVLIEYRDHAEAIARDWERANSLVRRILVQMRDQEYCVTVRRVGAEHPFAAACGFIGRRQADRARRDIIAKLDSLGTPVASDDECRRAVEPWLRERS